VTEEAAPADKKAAKEIGKAILSRMRADRHGSLAKIELPAVGDDDEPLTIYAKAMTIQQRSKVRELSGGCPHMQAVYTIILLALDENGEKLFSLGDVTAIKSEMNYDLIEALAMILTAPETYRSPEDAKKNFGTILNSASALLWRNALG